MSLPERSPAPQVLVVDDDVNGRRTLVALLRALGYGTAEAGNGREGLERVAEKSPDVVVLDIEMPEMNGWETLAALQERKFAGAVIVLTATDSTEDAVRALTGGADDFISKPCEVRELAARVNAVLRRTRRQSESREVLQLGDVRIDLAARVAASQGRPVALTRTEFRLIEVLAAEPGRSLTRQELLERVWHYAPTASSRTVDTYIWRLRRKICPTPDRPQFILTTPDGYRLATSSYATAIEA